MRVSGINCSLPPKTALAYFDSGQPAGNRLLARLPEFFGDYTPAASLLHGDLWGGNWGATFGEVAGNLRPGDVLR